ncbi:MAG: efflux RND transporter periplasmic adaptor subunit [Gammaproteobacteria bacterium]
MTHSPNIQKTLGVSLIVVIAALASGCGVGEASVSVEAPPTAMVPVVTAQPFRGEAVAENGGTVNLEADSEASVIAKVPGEVKEILIEEGEMVKAGQVLARLDRDRLSLELEQAVADLNKLKQEYRRNVELHERGLVSEGAFENLRYDMEALDAAYRLAKLELDYSEIRAPISGVVSERMIKVGNTLLSGDPVFRITNGDTLIAYLYVPQSDLYHFDVGQTAELAMDALPGEIFAAEVLRISPRIDPKTGTFRVTLGVDQGDNSLRAGMFGRVRVAYDVHEDALLVPAEAVLAEDSSSAVYVVEDGVARRRPISIGLSSDAGIEVLSGLDGTESVIVVGQTSVKDGTPVSLQDDGHRI